jgi:hypothetical protein
MKDIILTKIQEIISTSKPDGVVTRLRYNSDLWSIILEFTKNFTFKNKAEQVYFYSQQYLNKPICKCSKPLTFISITSGYREFCSTSCTYAKDTARDRRIATMEKNGGIGLANPATLLKAKNKLQEKHGIDVTNPGQIKSHKLNMTINNSMKDPKVIDSIRNQCLIKYGVDWHSKRQDVRSKMIASSFAIYGVSNHSQLHYSVETWRYLTDYDSMKSLFDTLSVSEISTKLNVSETTVLKHLKILGIRLPTEIIPEKQLANLLALHGFNDFSKTRKVLPSGKELDLYSPSLQIGIEYCGLYWHSERYSKSTDHRNKWIECKEQNIKLISIFEDEWILNRKIVESRLLHMLKKQSVSVGARSLVIKKITQMTSDEFLKKYHLGGSARASIHYAAFDKNENIRAVMSFSKHRKLHKPLIEYEWEMVRFSTDLTHIPGIASKLFSKFVKDLDPISILSYSDLRYGEGNYLANLGFIRYEDTGAGYWYFSLCNPEFKRYHRLFFTKKELLKKYPALDPNLTEYEMARNAGFERIWDCGNARWIWTNPNQIV